MKKKIEDTKRKAEKIMQVKQSNELRYISKLQSIRQQESDLEKMRVANLREKMETKQKIKQNQEMILEEKHDMYKQ